MIAAIDCDLRTSYLVTDQGHAYRGVTPSAVLDTLFDSTPTVPEVVLFEIASPVSFNRGASGHAAMTQLAKWAIWNSTWAGLLHAVLCTCGKPAPKFLVAPSNVWTRGYDLKTRHAMAKCKQPKKDLRECEAMIWFYKQRPQDWKTLPDYLATL